MSVLQNAVAKQYVDGAVADIMAALKLTDEVADQCMPTQKQWAAMGREDPPRRFASGCAPRWPRPSMLKLRNQVPLVARFPTVDEFFDWAIGPAQQDAHVSRRVQHLRLVELRAASREATQELMRQVEAGRFNPRQHNDHVHRWSMQEDGL